MKWVANHSGGLVALDDAGNVFVTGSSFGGDYVTTKFNSTGLQQWIQYYNGTGNSTDFPSSIAVDKSGNVYVTGSSSGIEYDYATIKYNTVGDSLWVARFNGQGVNYSHEEVSSIAVDDSGYVYVTGLSGTPGDFATIKYDSAGDSVWVRKYNGPGNPTDYAASIAVDEAGNVYVTGYSYGSGTNGEYATIKYNSYGDSVWVKRYSGPGNSYGFGRALAIDDSGNVYVTGYCTGNGTAYDYTTIKYNSTGVQQWIESYNGPGNSHDYSVSIAADNSGNVYVTGYSYGDGTDYDFATIKYSQLTGIAQISSFVPSSFSLEQNYPNLFNPITNLEFGISDLGFVSLKVYDILGKEVITLVNEKLSPGKYEVEFDGSGLPSGVYFYRLTAGEFTDTKRMMLVK